MNAKNRELIEQGERIAGLGLVFLAKTIKGVLKALLYLFKVLTGNFFVIGLLVFFIGSFFASTVFESAIQEMYPEFSGEVMLSSAVFLYGITYAIIERNIVIGIVAVVASCIVPMFHQYFSMYWPVFQRVVLGG